MRILLTGGSGQVGTALLPILSDKYDVVAPPRAVFDLAAPQMLGDALDNFSPDLIINSAAYTAVDRAEDEADVAFKVNQDAPGVIANWAAKRNVPVIHLSTEYVFDGKGDLPLRETSPTGPLSVYGKSKLAGEHAIRQAVGPHLIVRTSWVYAARGNNFLRTIARLARERDELRIVADQFGAPTSARVIAQALERLIAGQLSDLGPRFAKAEGIVNIVSAGETSWHGFASSIVEGLRSRNVVLAVKSILPLRTDEYPTKAKRPSNSRLDLKRLQEVFGVTTPTWQTALECELDELAREMVAN
ncbi:MAG: dTDP-4-dehydrorhamnose reductase [Bradyrhizobium sp.]|nr:dTDP-4-dehydrorhamnose reductase [Bradyrhizobium sp.]